MLNQLFSSALAVSSVAAAIIYENEAASLAARQTVTNCPALHVVACGGANSTVPASIGRLGTLANNITSMVPDSDFVSVPYDKIQVGAEGKQLMPGAVDQGIMNFETYVAEFSASCPNSKMAFIGYSSGAVIAMGSFCGGSVSHSLAGTSVVAVAVYGDQTRVPGLSYDIGTGGKSCVGLDASLRNPASCGPFASIIESWCDVNDPECCGGPSSDYMIHLSYPGKYDLVAAKFVVDSYNKAVGTSSNSSTSSNSTMSATSSSATATGTGIIGGGLGGSGTTTATSATVNSSASASSMASALSALGAGASGSSTAASSAASSMASGASAAATSAVSSVASAATSAASQASSTLTAANPNGASLLAPSFGLGALAVIMVALY